MYKVKGFLIITVLLFWGTTVFGQYQIEGFSLANDAHSWYDQAMGKVQDGLFVGQYEPVFRIAAHSHAFYHKDNFQPNTIKYRGQIYDSAFLMYNIENDLITVRYPEMTYFSQPVLPMQQYVEWFTMNDHFFRFYPERIMYLHPGFYDERYIGQHLSLVVKRIKQQTIQDNHIEYNSADIFLICYDGVYHKIHTRRSIIRIMMPQKQAIRKYIRQNGLHIKTKYEEDVLKLIQYCDQLITSN